MGCRAVRLPLLLAVLSWMDLLTQPRTHADKLLTGTGLLTVFFATWSRWLGSNVMKAAAASIVRPPRSLSCASRFASPDVQPGGGAPGTPWAGAAGAAVNMALHCQHFTLIRKPGPVLPHHILKPNGNTEALCQAQMLFLLAETPRAGNQAQGSPIN